MTREEQILLHQAAKVLRDHGIVPVVRESSITFLRSTVPPETPHEKVAEFDREDEAMSWWRDRPDKKIRGIIYAYSILAYVLA